MSVKIFSGYRGKTLETIKKVDAEVGDMLRVAKKEEIYEGIRSRGQNTATKHTSF